MLYGILGTTARLNDPGAAVEFKDLGLRMRPSDYWRRQCKATYQTDRIPHPDGSWPDSQEFIQRELGHLPAAVRRQIVCENAAGLYF